MAGLINFHAEVPIHEHPSPCLRVDHNIANADVAMEDISVEKRIIMT